MIKKRNVYALDHICHSAGFMAARTSQLLHTRWIHSPAARYRSRCSDNPINQWAAGALDPALIGT